MNSLSGHCRTNWTDPDADAGLTESTYGKNADAGLTVFPVFRYLFLACMLYSSQRPAVWKCGVYPSPPPEVWNVQALHRTVFLMPEWFASGQSSTGMKNSADAGTSPYRKKGAPQLVLECSSTVLRCRNADAQLCLNTRYTQSILPCKKLRRHTGTYSHISKQ